MEIRPPGPPRILACPVCGKPMEIVVKARVPVDRCPLHGVWLDREEFDQVLRGKDARRRRALAVVSNSARDKGRTEGALFGVWSFLLK